MDRLNNLKNLPLSLNCPTQASYPNLVLSRCPTTFFKPCSNQHVPDSLAQTLIKSFHQFDDFPSTISCVPWTENVYLARRTFTQMLFGSCSNRHCYFPNRAWLKDSQSLKPKPPNSFGLQITSQLTHVTLRLSSFPPQRNDRIILLHLFMTPCGMLKKDK